MVLKAYHRDAGNPLVNYWRLFWIGLAITVAALIINFPAYTAPPASDLDPMQDKTSLEVRDAFAKCREVENPMSQFFCNCRILEKQCEAPRRAEHGQWNTVEYWPTNNEADREVQFILFMNDDLLSALSPVDTGLVMTCLGGISDLNVFVGQDVDPDTKPLAMIGEETFKGAFKEDNGDWILGFEDNDKIYRALSKGRTMDLTYRNMENAERSLEFTITGFGNVTKGWEPLCVRPSS